MLGAMEVGHAHPAKPTAPAATAPDPKATAKQGSGSRQSSTEVAAYQENSPIQPLPARAKSSGNSTKVPPRQTAKVLGARGASRSTHAAASAGEGDAAESLDGAHAPEAKLGMQSDLDLPIEERSDPFKLTGSDRFGKTSMPRQPEDPKLRKL